MLVSVPEQFDCVLDAVVGVRLTDGIQLLGQFRQLIDVRGIMADHVLHQRHQLVLRGDFGRIVVVVMDMFRVVQMLMCVVVAVTGLVQMLVCMRMGMLMIMLVHVFVGVGVCMRMAVRFAVLVDMRVRMLVGVDVLVLMRVQMLVFFVSHDENLRIRISIWASTRRVGRHMRP